MELKIDNWKEVLEVAKLDEDVGIRIAQLSQNEQFPLYVAEVRPQEKINPHYHQEGSEVYVILEGAGILHIAKATNNDTLFEKQSKRVMAGDFFTIQPGFAHQLENTGEISLIFIFGCSPYHLSDDRFFVEDIV